MRRAPLRFEPQSLALLVLFFLSGITGLIYEVAWTRMLTLVFGHTVHAVSTVLAAFMGGLALGSYLFGRLADRLRRPLVVYAVLEVGVGVFALAVPSLFAGLDVFFAPLYQRLQERFMLFALARFAVCFGLLLLPTILMGATLPVLTRAAVRESRTLGAKIGRLYAVNTLGAVVGCFLSGFVLIEVLGVSGTIRAAAALNLALAAAAGCVAIVAGRAAAAPQAASLDADREPEGGGSGEAIFPGLLLPIYAVSGLVALALEVAWTRALIFSLFVGSSTYAFSTMLTIFLLGLGAGSLLAAPLVDGLRDRMRALVWAQAIVGIFAILSVPALAALSGLHARESGQVSWLFGTLGDVLKSATVMLAPTLAMGAMFPLFARVYVGTASGAGGAVGRLYFANTAGAIVGAVGAGFWLIPALGLSRSIVLLGGISVSLGAVLLALSRAATPRLRLAGAACAAGALALAALLPGVSPLQKVGRGESLLYYREGSAGTVAVVETPSAERRLQIDNVWIAGTNPVMRTAHKTLAHVPSLLHPDPKNVLTVGFASGGTSYSFTRHAGIERIECVEIADEVLKTREFFSSINDHVLDDPRFRIALEDARSYLLLGNGAYDIIATDCTDLRYKSDANLYTLEYFQLCRRRLREDGLLVVFLPFGGLAEPVLRGVLGTFQEVFPDGTLWYLSNHPTHYFLLVGSTKPLEVDWPLLRGRVEASAVAADLADVNLDDPYRILASFLMDSATLRRFVAGARTNSVDRPWVEFEAPRAVSPGLLDNLELVLYAADPTIPPVSGMSGEERSTLDRTVRASRAIARGHIHASRGQMNAARYEYEEAAALLPEDVSLQRILGMAEEQKQELLRRLAARPGDMESRYDLALLLRRRGDLEPSAALLREVLEGEPGNFSAAMSLGVTLEKMERFEEATRQYAAARTVARVEPEARVAQLAARALEKKLALRQRPEDVQAALELAQDYASSGDLYEALRFLTRRVEERHESRVAESLAYLFLQADMIERAEEQAKALASRDPASAAAHYYLTDVYVRKGRLDEAERELELSRALDDKNPSLWFAAARLYCLEQRPRECTEALRKVLLFGGPDFLRLARKDSILGDSASLAEVAGGAR